MMDHRTISGFSRDKSVRARDIDRTVVRRVFGYVAPYRGALIGFILTVTAGAFATSLPPLLLKALLDTAVPHKNRGMVVWLALGAVGLAFGNAILSLVQRWYSARIGEGLIFDL